MLSVANDCAGADVHVSSIYDIAKLLNKSESAIYGPSLELLEAYNSVLNEWKQEIRTVSSVSVILDSVKNNFDLNTSEVETDAPELLQVSSGFAKVRQSQINEWFENFDSQNLVKAQKRQLTNTHAELIKHLEKLSDSFLSFRHLILFSRGQVTEFRASKKALLSVVKAANNTNGTGEFEEV